MKKAIAPYVPALLALAAWAALVETGVVQHRAVAGPVATAQALADGLVSGTLLSDLGATTARAGAGVAVGLILGLPLGLWVGGGADRQRTLEPSLDFLRAIPPLLIYPILLMAVGYGETARVGAIGYATVLVISLHVASGVRHVHPERTRYLRAVRATRLQVVRWLTVYEVFPHCVTGARHAIAVALIVAVVTEMVVGAPHGLGTRAISSQIAYDTPGVYAVVLLTGLLGYAAARLILALERALFFWRDDGS